MKKLFSFNKFFISFCVLFLLVWIALQIVNHMRIKEMAKLDGERVLAWTWPEKNVRSAINIYDTKLLKKDHNEIIAKVLAVQSIQTMNSGADLTTDRTNQVNLNDNRRSASDCSVTLTYYRTNDQWFLGKVDCE
jgi:hypothetical protein